MLQFYHQIFSLLSPREKRRFGLVFAMILIMGLIEAASIGTIFPFLGVLSRPELIETNPVVATVYDLGGFSSTRSFLITFGVFVFCFQIFGLVFKTLTTYAINRFSLMRSHSIGLRLLQGYLAQPYAWHLNRNSADLATKILSEAPQVVSSSLLPAMNLIAAGIIVTFLFVLLAIVDLTIALIGTAFIGGFYAVVFLFVRRILLRIGEARRRAFHDRHRATNEATGGIKDIKVLGLEQEMARRFGQSSFQAANYVSIANVLGATPRYMIEGLLFGMLILVVLYIVIDGDGGLMAAIPVLGIYAYAGLRLFPAIQGIYASVSQIRFGATSLRALYDDLQSIEMGGRRILDPPAAPLALSDKLELKGVRYAYPEAAHPALDGLDLVVPARATVGIVGGTGAGKTTAVDIILGLLTPQDGALFVDGRRIETDDDLNAWRHAIGYVPQQIYLSDDSVAANIAFGVAPGEIDRAAVERAARIAELHDFVISDLPQGYDTPVGERGVRLSGGQRQRIGIARALYRDPPVLVLDEATSSLDNITEEAVMDALRNLGHTKTIIMIAHRLSTVRACDRIFLMEGGQVTAEGTFDELKAGNETFRRMARGVI